MFAVFIEILESAVHRKKPVDRREVINAWPGTEPFKVPVSGAVTDQVAEPVCFRTVGYDIFIDIAEMNYPYGACRYTIRKFTNPDKIGTKITLGNSPFLARAACFRGIRRFILVEFLVMFPGENPGRIRAACHAEFAANAAVIVDQHYAICPFESRTHRTNTDAHGIITMKTGFREPVW